MASSKNYKVSCVGIDDNGLGIRLVFYVYGVKTITEAIEQVLSDPKRQFLMKKYEIDPALTTFRTVRCNQDGSVPPSDQIKEEKNREDEDKEIAEKAHQQKYYYLDRQ